MGCRECLFKILLLKQASPNVHEDLSVMFVFKKTIPLGHIETELNVACDSFCHKHTYTYMHPHTVGSPEHYR